MGDNAKTASLRYLPATNQCELVVNLNSKCDNVPIQEELHSVRKVTDTLESLIQHTRNKLIKIINDKSKYQSGDKNEEKKYSIPIDFKRVSNRKKKPIAGNKVLEVMLKENHDKTVVRIFNEVFKLIINPPLVKHFQLPKVLFATYPVQVSRFTGLYIDRRCSEYEWFRSKDKNNWDKIGDEYEYIISEVDIGYYLKVICIPISRDEVRGNVVEAISQGTVMCLPELPKCPFEEKQMLTKNILKGKHFRFVTYNTLSNRYTELDNAFSYCPSENLAIEYRKQLIMKELLGYNADILCLQEIDDREYRNYFSKKFTEHGYFSKFQRKGNYSTEGLVCAVRKSRYKVLISQQIVLSTVLQDKKMFESLHKTLKKNKDLIESLIKQPTSLQVTVLKCKEMNRILLIGNTHLYYHPEATLVRLIQAYIIVKHLTSVKERLQTEWKNFMIDVIFCGDLNTGPHTAVYNFLSEGKLPRNNVFLSQISGFNKRDFRHSLNFSSACGTPKYTNYTCDFKDCLDYIFIQIDKIGVEKIVPLPEEELEQYVGLPNDVYPSDHLALVVDLCFRE